MAVYQFSALSDGQAISFNPTADRLNFDQTTIAAGDLTLMQEGSDLRVVVKSGPIAGKDVVLLSIGPEEIATSNFTFADGSVALIGDNSATNTNDLGANVLNGGVGRDLLMGLGGNDTLNGGDNNDSIVGGDGNDAINGNNGNDWLEGNAGNDSLTGSGGQDTFIFREAGVANADSLPDFASNWDAIQLDAAGFSAIGATGRFTASDQRFFAGTAAHDADDRIIFNSATGQIFYDADGNGAGAQQLIATVGAGRPVVAGDFTVIGTPGGTPTIIGTPGDDTITGTPGNDTIDGLGGNDSINGGGGSDSLIGGAGNDYLSGGGDPGDGPDHFVGGDGNDTLDGEGVHGSLSPDTMDGGAGDDLYIIDHPGDLLSDSGGIDTVRADDMDWTLATGLENLIIDNQVSEGGFAGTGNAVDNQMSILWGGRLDGLGGNDTLLGTDRSDQLFGGNGNDVLDGSSFDLRTDTLDGGAGNDTLTGHGTFVFDAAPGAANADILTVFTSGNDSIQLDGSAFAGVGFNGRFSVGDARFYSAPGATGGHDEDDRIIYNSTTGQLFYDADGSGAGAAQLFATLQGAPAVAATDFIVANSPGQVINGTSGDDSLMGTTSNDTINGFDGNDTIDGGVGADSMVGGNGNDLYFLDNDGDQVVEANNAGIDEVRSSVNNYTLPDFVNNLTLTGSASSGNGNAIDNVLTANASGSTLSGGDGNDTLIGSGAADWLDGQNGNDSLSGGALSDVLIGRAGNDTMAGGDGDDSLYEFADGGGNFGSDVIDGGAGRDWLLFDSLSTQGVDVNLAAGTLTSSLGNATLANIENVEATNGNDRLIGDAGNNTLIGFHGEDTFDGGLGNDVLLQSVTEPEGFADTFLFTVAPGAANADSIAAEWETGLDRIRLDATVMPELGTSGQFSGGDARFWAAAGANGGHDADDRVVYNTSTGQLWYDGDGSGAGAAQLLFTIGGARPVAATDIWVDNGSGGGGGGTINGTPGNDSLTGTAGNDTINGNAGNDTLRGMGGDDSLDGGSGTDLLDGGLGNDTYVVTTGDSLTDAGGNDTVVALNSWALGSGFENLILATGAVDGSGNSASNVIQGNAANNTLRARDGNDTVTGGAGSDFFDFTTAPSAANADTITDFATVDQLRFEDGAFTAIGATGTWGATDGRFFAAAGATAGHDVNDRVIYNTTTGALYYDADGSGAGAAQQVAILQGAPTLAATDITVI